MQIPGENLVPLGRDLLQRVDLKHRLPIFIAPCSVCRWPGEKFTEVIKKFTNIPRQTEMHDILTSTLSNQGLLLWVG